MAVNNMSKNSDDPERSRREVPSGLEPEARLTAHELGLTEDSMLGAIGAYPGSNGTARRHGVEIEGYVGPPTSEFTHWMARQISDRNKSWIIHADGTREPLVPTPCPRCRAEWPTPDIAATCCPPSSYARVMRRALARREVAKD